MKNTTFGHLLAFVTIGIWGTTFIFSKILLERLSAMEILIFRYILAIAALLLIHRKYKLWTSLKEELLFAALGATGMFLYFTLEIIALEHTQATNVSFIVTLSPIFTAFLAHFFNKDEKFHSRLLLGFLLAGVGVTFIIFEGRTLQLNPLGDILAIMAALSFSIYSTLLRKVNNEFHVVYVTRKSFFYGLFWILLFTLLRGEQLRLPPFQEPEILFSLLFLGIVASCCAFLLWNLAVGAIGSVKASNYIYFVPVAATIMAVIILEEKLKGLMIPGAVLILAGLIISQRKTLSKSAKKKSHPISVSKDS